MAAPSLSVWFLSPQAGCPLGIPPWQPSCPAGRAGAGWARLSALCWEGSRALLLPRPPFPPGITGSKPSPISPAGFHRGMEVGRGHSVGADWGCELSHVLETPFCSNGWGEVVFVLKASWIRTKPKPKLLPPDF